MVIHELGQIKLENLKNCTVIMDKRVASVVINNLEDCIVEVDSVRNFVVTDGCHGTYFKFNTNFLMILNTKRCNFEANVN